MASKLKKNTSDKIIEDILNETGNPQFTLICEANSEVAPTEMDEVKEEESIVSLPVLIQERRDSHSNSELISLANGSEVSQSSLGTAGDNLVTEDHVVSPSVTGITGFETVVDDIVEEASVSDHVTLDPQSDLTVIEELNYTDNNGVLIPKFVGEDTEDVTLTEEETSEVTTATVETAEVSSAQAQSQPLNMGALVGVTELGGNLVNIGGQHFLLFAAGTPVTTEIQGQTQFLIQPMVSGQEGVDQPALKRLRTEDTLTSPLTEEGVENLVGFDAAHPNVQVEVIEEEHREKKVVLEDERCDEISDITQSWFTTRDDKNRLKLQSKGSTWKQGQWAKDEVDMLKSNIDQYCRAHNIADPGEIIFDMTKDERKNFYRVIAIGLNRPLFSVYRRVIRMYDQKNHLGKYSPAELEKLKELKEKLGPDWSAIGAKLGRSASSVKDRCRLLKEKCYSGKWLPEEEKLLTDVVYKLSGAMPGMDVTTGLSWAAVAEYVGSRTEKQCRTKWLNYLNWKNRGGTEWSRADDFLLIDKVCNLNVTEEVHINWEHLAKGWSSVRSPQWLRGKWWSLKRHIIPDNQNMQFTAILEQLKANMKDMSRPSVSRPDLQFAVKIDKPHTVSHTQTVATTPSCYDGTTNTNTATLSAANRGSSVHSASCKGKKSGSKANRAEHTHTLSHSQTEPVQESSSLIMYSDSAQPSQLVVLVDPDQTTSDTQQILQIELQEPSPMMSSAVSD